MKIEFGSKLHLSLLDLQSKLKYDSYTQLGLKNLDNLKQEIDSKAKQIRLEQDEKSK